MPYYAVLGEFEAQLNNPQAAVEYFPESLARTGIKSEQRFLLEGTQECEAHYS